MENSRGFRNFDDKTIFDESQNRALTDSTRNFVVEFGKDEANIAFDLDVKDVKALLNANSPQERPVRWINIWGPNKQEDIVDLLGKHYKFSPRLLAVIKTVPPAAEQPVEEKHDRRFRPRSIHKEVDLELASKSLETSPVESSIYDTQAPSHYEIAKQMLHFQSTDFGEQYLCIGANWLHEVSNASSEFSIDAEGKQRPLWSWLILCDDHTVLSLHEDVGSVQSRTELKSMRSNTLSVLSQLSTHGHMRADPISLQSVRQGFELGSSSGDPGLEGASNLFYYLFDDWRAVYSTSAGYRNRLKALQKVILEDMTRKSNKAPNIEIIPRLHILGGQIRQMQHLYGGYKNLIKRILEPRPGTQRIGSTTTGSFSNLTTSRGVVLAESALTRFERLGDRISLLILSETKEFLAEKEALINTYFNINAQKDSEATARLTRAATLLAKLSVLFLPVSLMTSYFSVQITELNHYTAHDYWYAFAVIMSLSFVGLFFFSKLLMRTIEILDDWVGSLVKRLKRSVSRRPTTSAP